MLQITDDLLILMVYTVVLDCCILLVFGLCFCLEYLEGGCLTGQSRFTFLWDCFIIFSDCLSSLQALDSNNSLYFYSRYFKTF